MFGQWKLGACLPTFASCADRYCLGGYGRGGATMEEMLAMARKVEGLDGLELVGNWHINDGNIEKVTGLFRDNGFSIPMIVPDLWTQAKWGRGQPRGRRPRHQERGGGGGEEVHGLGGRRGLRLRGRVARPGRVRVRLPGRLQRRVEVAKEGMAECAAHTRR